MMESKITLVLIGGVMVFVSPADAHILESDADYMRIGDRIYQRPPKNVNPFEHPPEECPRDKDILNWWHRR